MNTIVLQYNSTIVQQYNSYNSTIVKSQHFCIEWFDAQTYHFSCVLCVSKVLYGHEGRISEEKLRTYRNGLSGQNLASSVKLHILCTHANVKYVYLSIRCATNTSWHIPLKLTHFTAHSALRHFWMNVVVFYFHNHN